MLKGWGGFVGGSWFKVQWGKNLPIKKKKKKKKNLQTIPLIGSVLVAQACSLIFES